MHILLTGATGLIGGELAGLLAGRGHAVTVLARSRRTVSRNDGSPLATDVWNGRPPPAGTLALVAGDIGLERLGLDQVLHDTLADSLDLVIHCAAAVGFALDPALYERVNVGGAARILALSETRRPRPVPLLHVSTAYVCGERSGAVGEDELDPDQDFANGYEASKARAEQLVGAARERGVPVAIARPSIVVGAWNNGAIGSFDNLYGMLRLLAEGRIRVLPAAGGASLDLVPIDHVCGALVQIAERMHEAAGRNFHLVSGSPVPVAALAALGRYYPNFHAPRLLAPALFRPDELGGAARRLYDRAIAPYSSYLRRDPRFRDDNLHALCGSRCPPTDVPFLRRLVDHCIASGFLREPGQPRAG
jgi:thioester reductase-like protein